MEIRSGQVPFRWWIIDDFLTPLKPDRMADAMLHKWEVAYDNDVERGKKTSRNFAGMIPELQTAFTKLRCEKTVKMLADLTNIHSLQDDPIAHGAGLHLSVDGSFLQCHTDYEVHPELPGKERRLNLLQFMHHEWNRAWGGQLLLCDPMGKAVVEIDPLPGRLAIFECGPASYHGVRVITGKQAVRLSCAVYYLADARPTAIRRRAMFMPNRNRGGVPAEVS